MHCRRLHYAGALLITIAAGLATRHFTQALPDFVVAYAGDALYATAVFFTLRLLFPYVSLTRVVIACFALCVLIEVLQLYQAPWIQSIRHTPPFGLLLGFGFLWSDILCYLIGTLLGFFAALMLDGHTSLSQQDKALLR